MPFTTGILIGIGETRAERIEALLTIRDLHERHGHIQEVIVQNFRAKPDTRMSGHPEPSLDELLWTCAAARLVPRPGHEPAGAAQPVLDEFPRLLDAGINDWGGVSPVTIDHVNPEAPWPELARCDTPPRRRSRAGGAAADLPEYFRRRALRADVRGRQPCRRVTARSPEDMVTGADVGGGRARSSTARDGRRSGRRRVDEHDGAARVGAACAGLAQWPRTRTLDERDSWRCSTRAEPSLARGLARRRRAAPPGLRRHGDLRRHRNINYTNVCYFRLRLLRLLEGQAHGGLRGKPTL